MIAQDTHRSSKLFEKSNVFGIIRNQFFNLTSDFNSNVITSAAAGTGAAAITSISVNTANKNVAQSLPLLRPNNLTVDGALASLNVLMKGSAGIASDYIMAHIPSLREPLTKVSKLIRWLLILFLLLLLLRHSSFVIDDCICIG